MKSRNEYPMMRRDMTLVRGVEAEEAIEIARHCFFNDSEMQLSERIVKNAEDFRVAYAELLKYWNYERYLAEIYAKTGREVSQYYGNCEVCNSPQPFIVDYQSAELQNGRRIPNWRERLVCPNCGCNNRQRFVIRTVFENYRMGMNVLMYEEISVVFQQIRREIPNLSGFEYQGEGYENGMVYNGATYQNICKLGYENERFELVIANDVFEHAPDYKKAFQESYRILKPGGKLVFTVPFDANCAKTEIRPIDSPIYHNNPIEGKEPLLVYQIFGWDMLEMLRECGFTDAYGKVYYGMKEGYLGYLPLYFEACK